MHDDHIVSYLGRIGLTAPPPLTADGLASLQIAHRIAIPFENLDIPLGRSIEVGSDAVFAKLVTRRRGGYCFEQNRLFADVLTALGFLVRPLLGRVHLNQPEGSIPPRTHMLLTVEVEGRPWIADAGFGGAYVPPILLRDGDYVQGPDGAWHRLVHQAPGGTLPGEWRLDRAAAETPDSWQAQYSFDLAEVAEADFIQANHWTSTRPGERFTTFRILSIATPGGFVSLVDRTLRETGSAGLQERGIGDADAYRAVLAKRFGIDLSGDEIDRLNLFPRR